MKIIKKVIVWSDLFKKKTKSTAIIFFLFWINVIFFFIVKVEKHMPAYDYYLKLFKWGKYGKINQHKPILRIAGLKKR